MDLKVRLRAKDEGRGIPWLLIFHDLNFAADSIELVTDKARTRQRPKIVKKEPRCTPVLYKRSHQLFYSPGKRYGIRSAPETFPSKFTFRPHE